MSRKLHGIAKVTNAPAETISVLGRIRNRLERNGCPSLSSKGQDIIREVLAGDVWHRVTALPESLLAEADGLRKRYARKSLALATVAIQILILTRAPIRCCDLISIRIGVNLMRQPHARDEFLLDFPDHDNQKRIDFQFPLSRDTSLMISRFLKRFHPDPITGAWLFGSANGKRRTSSHASDAIGTLIEERIGIRITAQQFRHAAAVMILKEAPGIINLYDGCWAI